MSDQSIEDVLAENRDPQHPNPAELVLHVRTGAAVDRLAAADLPLVDRERGIAVIRLDPEALLALRGLHWALIDAITEDATYVPSERDLETIENVLRLLGWNLIIGGESDE